ncbi:hypothetical protein NDU88_001293 [Pleurodeles waltl]|uniref:Uncharacterized protein n=1 Tax=Pleurodeles waltl TaxID=8319 RepID=A0AAV7U9W4_PLEWA|nr:hypothetical protein NDU88_001293 [Pleurodeles waltl]
MLFARPRGKSPGGTSRLAESEEEEAGLFQNAQLPKDTERVNDSVKKGKERRNRVPVEREGGETEPPGDREARQHRGELRPGDGEPLQQGGELWPGRGEPLQQGGELWPGDGEPLEHGVELRQGDGVTENAGDGGGRGCAGAGHVLGITWPNQVRGVYWGCGGRVEKSGHQP